MPTIYARRLMKSGMAAAILVLALPNLGSAQAKGPSWVRFQISRIKPEMRQEYEGYVKQVVGAYKKSGAPFYVVYENVAGDLTEYTSVYPMMKFGEMDGPNPIAKVLGDEALANLQRNVARCLTSQTRYYALPQDDLTINKGPLGTIFMQTRTTVASGKVDEYLSWMKSDYKPALEKAGVTQLRVSRPVFGAANTNQIETVRMMKDFSELDGGPYLIQKLGADAARALNAKVSGIVQATRITIIRIRPDLSYVPAAPGTN
jgi:hypothetical protein